MSNNRVPLLRLTLLNLCLLWHFPSMADRTDRNGPFDIPVTEYEQALALELITRIDEALRILSSQNQDGTSNRVLADYRRNIREALGDIRSADNGEPDNETSCTLACLSLSELLKKIESNARSRRIVPFPQERGDRRAGRRLAAISFHEMEPVSENRFAVLSVERSLRLRRFNYEITPESYATIFALILCFRAHETSDDDSIRLGASIATSQWLHAVNNAYNALINVYNILWFYDFISRGMERYFWFLLKATFRVRFAVMP